MYRYSKTMRQRYEIGNDSNGIMFSMQTNINKNMSIVANFLICLFLDDKYQQEHVDCGKFFDLFIFGCFYWGRTTKPESSSGDPNHINYRGPEPFSEPESSAIKDIILYSRTPFKIFLSFHAYSEVICFPWCHAAEPCADYVNMLEGGTVMAKAIYQTTRRMYKVGNFKDLMYYACGTSIDWSYGSAHIPYSYLIELRSKEHRFLLPKEEIQECCNEILNAVKALALFVDERKRM